eukprot:TRINITY_DN3970_c0_g1_i1.p1 TRINITY_DN3970_c0_g1~~TRINITY_DN3970_c0_g1_i1.p1  ORF type:complete len:355 (-),score=97.73 TRINITY_DN3970_c0_g1_i1:10-942(-)
MQHIADWLIERNSQIFRPSDVSWEKFPDGFPNLFVQNSQRLRDRHVVILLSFFNIQEIFSQISVLYALPRFDVKSLTAVLAFFPTGTMERVDKEGQIATAMTLARILSNTPITSGGPTKLVIFDIHSLPERFYFGDSVIPILESGIPLLLNELRDKKQKNPNSKITIAFPDEGACKRFGGSFGGYQLIICTKVREGEKRIVKIKEGDVNGQDVVIVDDLVQSGGTLIECRGALLAHGARSVCAYVTHAIFPKESWKKFLANDGLPPPFETFYITDSCPTAAILKTQPPFKVLSLAPLVYNYLVLPNHDDE